MHCPQSTPSQYQLRTGQALSLHLPQGHELFCQQGPLQLAIGPLSFTDNHFGQHMVLHTGQSWRSPSHTWVQLSTRQAGHAQVQVHQPQMQKSCTTPIEEAVQLAKNDQAQGMNATMAKTWWQVLSLRSLSWSSFRRGQRVA
ncbi:MAG: hypothetical protein RSE32_17245 [Comamonas sp.]|uniref:hypothetical protein n=1 Tax=Comamonas sp. TaxID=34028 RepID=UPI002FC8C7B1